jgi:hypothetical protein
MTDLKFVKLHDDATIPAADKYAHGLLVRAYLISETGRPNKSMIPSQSTRFVPTGIAIDQIEVAPLRIYTCHDLVVKSVFVVPGYLNFDRGVQLLIGLYNGGHQAYFVQHEEPLARLIVK